MNHVRFHGAMHPRRAMRQASRSAPRPFGPQKREQAQPINWPLCLIVAGAGFLALLALVYKFTGPA